MGKPIKFSTHGETRALQRGATREEIAECVSSGRRQDSRGRVSATKSFAFNSASPVNGLPYQLKTVEVLFADERDAVVIVTVKVYYSNA